MADESEEKIEERIDQILAKERRIERFNKIIPMIFLYIMGILMICAIAGILYKILKTPVKVEKSVSRSEQSHLKNLRGDREKFDLYFNSTFPKIVSKIDFVDSWFLNIKRDELTIRVKENWYDMKDYKKISILKTLREEFIKIYSNSSLSKSLKKSPVVNIINFNGDIIAVCDETGASLK